MRSRLRRISARRWRNEWFFRGSTVIEAVAGVAMLSLEAGLAYRSSWIPEWLVWISGVVLTCFYLRLFAKMILRRQLARRPLAFALGTFLATFASIRLAAGAAILYDVIDAIQWMRKERADSKVLAGVGHKPARSLVLSFLGMIAIGTLLLSLPAAASGAPVRAIDAIFTAVSATCVTGLITVDTATAWSAFGKSVILVLFQLGGLGIMVISAAMTLTFGRELGVREGSALQGVFEEANVEELRSVLRGVVAWTFIIEGCGALILWGRFVQNMPAGEALVHAVFHAVSAFCNAGFSLFSDSMVGFAEDPVVNAVLIVLITLGGLGFGVLVALWRLFRGQSKRLAVHVKLVLMASAVLVWMGALAYFYFEYDRSLAPLSWGGKLQAALFQSVTTRTAGFNSVPLENLHPVTMLVMLTLMFVGASPGSTGGGIKTTTLALVLLAARAFLLERQDVEAFGRRVPQGQILRALALTGGATASFVVGFGILLMTETLPFKELMFETVSALGTVGLSLGVTSELSPAGRLVICALMFFGRVGPLTAVAAAATKRTTNVQIVLPEGKILVG